MHSKTNQELAEVLKEWRGKVPAWKAADQLGIPVRTLQGVELGRGFPYPILLQTFMKYEAVDGSQS